MDRLQWLQPLAGGCWVAAGQVPGLGEYTAERAYSWVLGGQFLAERHNMDLGRYAMKWDSVIGWHPDAQKVIQYSFGNDGSIAVCELTVQNDELVIEGERFGGARPGPLRRRLKPVSSDQFIEVTEAARRGEWAPVMQMNFVRRTPAALRAEASTAL